MVYAGSLFHVYWWTLHSVHAVCLYISRSHLINSKIKMRVLDLFTTYISIAVQFANRYNLYITYRIGAVNVALEDIVKGTKEKLKNGEPIYYRESSDGEYKSCPMDIEAATVFCNRYMKYDPEAKLVWEYRVNEDDLIVKRVIDMEIIEHVFGENVKIKHGYECLREELDNYLK